jgi:hypothetical protein
MFWLFVTLCLAKAADTHTDEKGAGVLPGNLRAAGFPSSGAKANIA